MCSCWAQSLFSLTICIVSLHTISFRPRECLTRGEVKLMAGVSAVDPSGTNISFAVYFIIVLVFSFTLQRLYPSLHPDTVSQHPSVSVRASLSPRRAASRSPGCFSSPRLLSHLAYCWVQIRGRHGEEVSVQLYV